MEYVIKCAFCGELFTARYKGRMYCGDRCRKASCAKRAVEEVKNCPVCGEEFVSRHKGRTYCGDYCRQKAYKQNHGITVKETKPRKKTLKIFFCECCGKEFEAYYDSKIYCSEECKAKVLEERKKTGVVKKRKTSLTASQIAQKAREEHLTYGQYVAKYNL